MISGDGSSQITTSSASKSEPYTCCGYLRPVQLLSTLVSSFTELAVIILELDLC